MSSLYATKRELLNLQKHVAVFAERIALEFRSRGAFQVKALVESPNVLVNIGHLFTTYTVTLTGNRALSIFGGNPIRDRCKFVLEVTQGAGGQWTLTPNSSVALSADIPAIVLSTQPGKIDRLTFEYVASASKYRLLSIERGFVA